MASDFNFDPPGGGGGGYPSTTGGDFGGNTNNPPGPPGGGGAPSDFPSISDYSGTLPSATTTNDNLLTRDPLHPADTSKNKAAKKKGRTFQRKLAPLPDDYKGIEEIDEEKERLNHTERWLKAQKMRRGLVRAERRNHALDLLKYTSHSYYNNLWAEAQTEFRNLLKEEKNRGSGGGGDRKGMLALLVPVFFKYLSIYKKLDETYDQMVHPQKRQLVRNMVDLVLGRILELRQNLVNADLSEYTYFDQFCLQEKLLPSQLDIPIPNYYYHDLSDKQQQREDWFESFKVKKALEEKLEQEKREQEEAKVQRQQTEEKFVFMMDEESQAMVPEGSTMGLGGKGQDNAQFFLLIQKMERARQGKMRFRVAKYMSEEEAREKTKKKKKKAKQLMDPMKAAVIIQKLVRGFLARVRVKKLREEELELLGLRYPTLGDPKSSQLSPDAKLHFTCTKNRKDLDYLKQRRRTERRRNQKLYEDAQIEIEKRLKQLEGPEMAERFKHQIRRWMLWVKESTGKLPKKYLKPQQGGARFFICPDSLPEDILDKGMMAMDKEYAKKRKQELKKEKKKDKENKKAAKKKAMKGELDLTTKLEAPTFFEDMITSNIEYNKLWRARDESFNPEQRHEEKFIIHEKRELVGDQVRDNVDLIMAQELLELKELLEGKKGKKKAKHTSQGNVIDITSPSYLSQMRSKRRLRARTTRFLKQDEERKKTKGKDLTKGADMKDLVKELVDNGVIKQYPKVRLDSYLGAPSLINAELRSFWEKNPDYPRAPLDDNPRPMPGDANPLPSYGDVRTALKNIAILPLGGRDVHKMAPHTMSILLCGPKGVGKEMLINAVCTEMNATLMDLSAPNLAGKYLGKKGMKMLIHLVSKVGKAIGPTVVKIDDCDQCYLKKNPKSSEDPKPDPKRMKKEVIKLLDQFGPGDQMLLIGTSENPWRAPPKFLRRDYQKVIYVPKPDYGTRYEIWKNFLTPHTPHLDKDVHLSLLAKLSDGWTPGPIIQTIQTVVGNHKKNLEKDQKDKLLFGGGGGGGDEPWMGGGPGPGGGAGGPQGKSQSAKTQGKKLLQIQQFLDELTNYDPVFEEQNKLWNRWWDDTPLQAARMGETAPQGRPGDGDKKKKKDNKMEEIDYVKGFI